MAASYATFRRPPRPTRITIRSLRSGGCAGRRARGAETSIDPGRRAGQADPPATMARRLWWSASDPEASGASCSCGDASGLYEDGMVGDWSPAQQGLAWRASTGARWTACSARRREEALMGFQSSVGLEPHRRMDVSPDGPGARVRAHREIHQSRIPRQTQIVSAQADAASSRVILITRPT